MGFLQLFIPALFVGRHLLVTVVFFLNGCRSRVYWAHSLGTASSLTPPFAWAMHTSEQSHLYCFLWPSNSLSREVRRWDLGRSQGESSFRRWGRVPVTPSLKGNMTFWRRQLTTQNFSRVSKPAGVRGVSKGCSGTPKPMAAVSPKPIPVTFWHTCWDWWQLGGSGWTKARTWGQSRFFPQTSMYTWACHGRWRKADQELWDSSERENGFLFADWGEPKPSLPASEKGFGSCSLLGIRSDSAAVVELCWPPHT